MKDEKTNIFGRFARTPEMHDGDYIGDDGLIYCGTCGEPKQYLQPAGAIFGEDTKIKVMCKCEREALKRKREEEAARELEYQIARVRDVAFSGDIKYKAARFEDAENTAIIQGAKKYTELFADEFKPLGTGLLMYGDTGTGKSFAAACIANALIDKGYSAIMTNIPHIVNKMQASFEGRNEYIYELAHVDMLILDDLKAERQTEFTNEITFSVIDARYNAGKPLIVTTNLTADQIKATKSTTDSDKKADPYSSRLLSRILEKCHPIEVKGNDRRREAAKADYARNKALLGV